MSKRLVVIKLGGSALTDKRKIYTARVHVIENVSRQVAALAKEFRILLVHGAGSYGHIPVKKYGLEGGFRNSNQLVGLTRTKLKLLEWQHTLASKLADAGTSIMPFPASSCVVARDGRIVSLDVSPLKIWLRLGCVPMTGGDLVSDTVLGFSVVSGDQLAATLAQQLHASRLIFGIDVDGLFDSNPKINPDARLLTQLTAAAASKILRGSWKGTGQDVTGGMAGKLNEALFALKAGIPVSFVNLIKNERLRDEALGRRVTCTRLVSGR